MHISESTRAFIEAHRDDDVRDAALHARRDDAELDLPFALDQIAGRRTARTKLPEWGACDGIVYPPHVPMEQCSSQAAASAKADLARELVAGRPHPTSFVDLTGGFGVDCSYLARVFDEATYVERQEKLCALAEHNLRALGLGRVRVLHADGVDHLRTMEPVTMIYLDPARRDANGARTYAIGDCDPDALALRDDLLAKAPFVMIKLSPMLDWRRTVEDFAGAVSRLVVVSTGNECKEILVVLERGGHETVRVTCLNDDERLEFTTDEDQRPATLPADDLDRMRYLYEPNASIMKAGAFGALRRRFPGLLQIGPNSHLFVGAEAVRGFPGRAFEIEGVGTMNKRDVKSLLRDVTHANVAVRNFPSGAQQLRRRLGLKDGGDVYLFATSDAAGRHLLVRTRKAAPSGAAV